MRNSAIQTGLGNQKLVDEHGRFFLEIDSNNKPNTLSFYDSNNHSLSEKIGYTLDSPKPKRQSHEDSYTLYGSPTVPDIDSTLSNNQQQHIIEAALKQQQLENIRESAAFVASKARNAKDAVVGMRGNYLPIDLSDNSTDNIRKHHSILRELQSLMKEYSENFRSTSTSHLQMIEQNTAAIQNTRTDLEKQLAAQLRSLLADSEQIKRIQEQLEALRNRVDTPDDTKQQIDELRVAIAELQKANETTAQRLDGDERQLQQLKDSLEAHIKQQLDDIIAKHTALTEAQQQQQAANIERANEVQEQMKALEDRLAGDLESQLGALRESIGQTEERSASSAAAQKKEILESLQQTFDTLNNQFDTQNATIVERIGLAERAIAALEETTARALAAASSADDVANVQKAVAALETKQKEMYAAIEALQELHSKQQQLQNDIGSQLTELLEAQAAEPEQRANYIEAAMSSAAHQWTTRFDDLRTESDQALASHISAINNRIDAVATNIEASAIESTRKAVEELSQAKEALQQQIDDIGGKHDVDHETLSQMHDALQSTATKHQQTADSLMETQQQVAALRKAAEETASEAKALKVNTDEQSKRIEQRLQSVEKWQKQYSSELQELSDAQHRQQQQLSTAVASRLDSLDASVDNLQQKQGALRSELDSLSSKVTSDIEEVASKHKSQFESMQRAIAANGEQLQTTERMINDSKRESNSAMRRLSNDIETIRTESNALKQSTNVSIKELKQALKAKTANESELTDVKSSVKHLQSQVSSLERSTTANTEDLSGGLAKLYSLVDDLKHAADQQQHTTAAALSDQRSELEKKLNAQQTELQSIRRSIDEKTDEKMTAFTTNLVRSVRNELHEKCDAIKSEIAPDVNHLSTAVQSLREECERQSKALVSVSDYAHSLESDIQPKFAALQQLRDTVAELQECIQLLTLQQRQQQQQQQQETQLSSDGANDRFEHSIAAVKREINDRIRELESALERIAAQDLQQLNRVSDATTNLETRLAETQNHVAGLQAANEQLVDRQQKETTERVKQLIGEASQQITTSQQQYTDNAVAALRQETVTASNAAEQRLQQHSEEQRSAIDARLQRIDNELAELNEANLPACITQLREALLEQQQQLQNHKTLTEQNSAETTDAVKAIEAQLETTASTVAQLQERLLRLETSIAAAEAEKRNAEEPAPRALTPVPDLAPVPVPAVTRQHTTNIHVFYTSNKAVFIFAGVSIVVALISVLVRMVLAASGSFTPT